MEPAEDFLHQGAMALDNGDRFPITEVLFEFRRADQVREQQCQQPDAMLALEFLDFATMFECDLEIRISVYDHSAKGIPEDQIKPRENVFTFKAWNAQGRKVKKGEHGVKIHTVIETPIKEEVDPNTSEVRVLTKARPWTTTVLHISQTEPVEPIAPKPTCAEETKVEAEKAARKAELEPTPPSEQRFTPEDAVISVNFEAKYGSSFQSRLIRFRSGCGVTRRTKSRYQCKTGQGSRR